LSVLYFFSSLFSFFFLLALPFLAYVSGPSHSEMKAREPSNESPRSEDKEAASTRAAEQRVNERMEEHRST
jgi:hypothetical protein